MNTFRDDDVEFDLFDEPTVEAVHTGQRSPRLQRLRGRGSGEGPRRPPARPPPGLVPLARLAGLIALAIVTVVTLVTGITACEGPSKHAEYASYLSKVRALARDSNELGAQFTNRLRAPRLKASDLEANVRQYARQEQQTYDQAQQIRVPGPLRQAHQQLLDALELRAEGLASLSEALAQALPVKSAASSATLIEELTAQAELLTTSDVVWDQLYRTAATAQIKAQHVTGLVVPESHFIANTDLVGASSFGLMLRRLHGVSSKPAAAPLLKLGSAGTAVAAWQTQLDRWRRKAHPGQPLLAITGAFNPATETATKALQQAAGITNDGIVGPATRRALTRELAHPG